MSCITQLNDQALKQRLTVSILAGLLLACPASSASNEGPAAAGPSETAQTIPAQADQSAPVNQTAGASAATPDSAKPAPTVRLHGEVTECASGELSKTIEDLNRTAVEKIRQEELLAKEKHFKTPLARLAASTRDLAELCTEYRGFEQSSEAADVILGEKCKLKSRAAVAYAKQKQIDNTEERILTALMQIATGLGSKDAEQGKAAVREGSAELEELTSKEVAESTVQTLQSWCQTQKVVFRPPLAGPMSIQAECRDVLGRALQGDPVLSDIKHLLHKYNGRSKFARTTAKVVNTTLSIAAMSPTFVSPAAQVAWTAYIMTQGGPEESKLLKEVYLAKRFESRYQLLTNQTSLAVNSYNAALMSQNPALLAFSQYVIGQLCAPAPVQTAGKQVEPSSSPDKGTKEKSVSTNKDSLSNAEPDKKSDTHIGNAAETGTTGVASANEGSANPAINADKQASTGTLK